MLTDVAIRKAKVPGRLTDGHGLYLVITAAGGRLWRWKYRFAGVEKLMSFGGYPQVSLREARERHAAGRRLLASGVDPMAARKQERTQGEDTRTFEGVSRLWLDHWAVDKSPRHVDVTRRRLIANVYPHLGGRSIREIEAPDLVAMVKAIERRGVGDLARRTLETVGQIMRYAIAHGYAKRNPAADIKPADVLRPVRKRHLARVGAAELPGLLRAIEVYRGSPVTRLACKLMALTFVRTSELIGARWEEVDWDARRWNIPATRMKMRTPHIVPLSTQSLEVLRLLRLVTEESPYLFPGERSATMSNNTILFALRRMGYGRIMTGHGFRGVASTLLHEQGWPHEHIELQLAHSTRDAVSAAYNFALHLDGRASMMQAWGNYLEKCVDILVVG